MTELSRFQNILNKILSNLPTMKLQAFKNNPMRAIFQNELKPEIEKIVKFHHARESYKINVSIGNGNWADVPWLSIFNTQITNSAQSGIYPVYLFTADSKGVYLCLIQGTEKLKKSTHSKEEYLKVLAEQNSSLLSKYPELKDWDTSPMTLNSTTERGKSYEEGVIVHKFYSVDDIPSDEILKNDLCSLLDIYQKMKKDIVPLSQHNSNIFVEEFQEEDNSEKIIKINPDIQFTSLPKPFLILAGISGTGKTRFVREQAKLANADNNEKDNYCLVPVRPDWHEPSDLLGYISRLSSEPKYIVTPLLKFMIEAWQEIAQSAVEISEDFISGNESYLTEIRPFWLCLDEMNLAPVEQYFADYLSIIETREWKWDNNQFTYQCDAILSKNIIDEFADSEGFWQSLGLDKESKLAHYFRENGIPLPFNLIVAGTVNMDETTHGFSRKVLDRALSFDFSEFYPNNFDEFFDPQTHNKVLSYPIYSSATTFNKEDENIQASINFLNQLNTILAPTPFKLGYRALNELLLTVASFKPKNEEELQALWDDFLMYKILPRIEGDSDKLATNKGQSNLLKDIEDYLKKSLYLIWDKPRHDFLRVDNNDQSIQVEQCRSRVKLAFMIDKLEFGFTAFWQ